ncbi:PAS domain S-box-containing protein [Maribacter spongiicola]|uniref:histidine kinase n=1 Tax=Maribacter spongiicola TaxID=1206753 RepID=A0A4V3ER79_9FLAO|nr:PAS domain-containing sensor histidine kinase [Maribacter spongiicola]TDT43728.1 PAS domain S-box-containing protein [Maribacter spongiicola]
MNKEFHFLDDGGEMGKLMREKDWSMTPLGPPEEWPQSLRTTLNILLNCPFPMFLFWGKKLKGFYNDAYRPSLGKDGKHPFILGLNGKESWPEIWDDIYPLLTAVTERGETIKMENQLIPFFRNGRIEDIYWTFSYSPVKDESGNVAGVLTVCTDTTESVLAEKRLRESERRFREIANLSPMWIWITDADINVEYANKELLDFIGLSHYSEFEGQVWKSIVHPDDIELVFEGFSKAVEKQERMSLEYRVKNATTNEYEWFKIVAVPKFENGEIKGFLGTGMNIEQQKSYEENLKNEVDHRTKELASSNLKLEKMNKELQSFAYISSHDLQEPLRKIQMFAEVLMDNEYDQLSTSGKVKFEKIQSAANRMQALINDLLSYSRTDTEQRVFETIDLKDLVEDIKNDLGEELSKKEGTILLKNSCQLEVVHFQFRQLIYNLLSNSIKYSKADVPPVITVESEVIKKAKSIDPGLSNTKEYVQITITDNGIGFEEQFSEKIFEVFQRLHSKQEYVGTGIGLAIVKKIVQNHAGVISARGELNKGSVFTIVLPKKQ